MAEPLAAQGILSHLSGLNHCRMRETILRNPIKYETLEKLPVGRPVDRLSYISESCRGKTVLDIGCFDETALIKRDTKHWLHGRLRAMAREVVGIDNSNQIPDDGIKTGVNSIIYRGDGVCPAPELIGDRHIGIVVAGEFIEHIENPLQFFKNIKNAFPGSELLISTPNGVSFANTLLGTIGREVQHHDHLQIFTYKILNTLCLRAGFTDWEIIPYRFYATEMILQSQGLKRNLVRFVESLIRIIERMFPLLCFGYVVRIRL